MARHWKHTPDLANLRQRMGRYDPNSTQAMRLILVLSSNKWQDEIVKRELIDIENAPVDLVPNQKNNSWKFGTKTNNHDITVMKQ